MAVFVGRFIGGSFLLSFCRCDSFHHEYPQKLSGKGCVRDCQSQIGVDGSDQGGAESEALQSPHGGGLHGMGAALSQIPQGSVGGVDSSP